jgi:Uma2 family endonuclease
MTPITDYQLPITNYQLPITNYPLPITHYQKRKQSMAPAPSYHYSYTKAKLIGALLKLEKFTVFSELTLNIDDKTYLPDICLYAKRDVDLSTPDLMEMEEMPLLAIKILSQSQAIQDVLDEFAIYFGAVIKSCWLVVPVAGAVIIYDSPEGAQRFSSGNLIDEQLDIQIPIEEIFD